MSFLLSDVGKTKEYDVSHMYGALDLGGGSIQITFPLPDKVRL